MNWRAFSLERVETKIAIHAGRLLYNHRIFFLPRRYRHGET
jgi:hypothetical protein